MTKAREPSLGTLRKYGLTLKDWKRILRRQGGSCGLCHVTPPSGILHIDHDHVAGWKKMSPEERKMYVRGIVCYQCNFVYLRRGADSDRLRAGAIYLDRYAQRLAKDLGFI